MGGYGQSVANAAMAGLQQGRAQKQFMTDTELQTNLQDKTQQISGLQDKLKAYGAAGIGPDSLQWKQTTSDLAQANSARTALFHPDNHPTALAKLGHELLQHVHKTTAAAGPSTQSTTPQPETQLPMAPGADVAGVGGAPGAAVPSTPGPTLPAAAPIRANVQGPVQTPAQGKALMEANLQASALRPAFTDTEVEAQRNHASVAADAQKRQAMIQFGIDNNFSPDLQQKLTEHVAGIPRDPIGLSKLVPVFDPETGKTTYQPTSDAAGMVVPPKAVNTKPTRAWTRKNGKITSVLLNPQTNQPIPGSENSDILPPATMTGRMSTGFFHYVDADGNVHQIAETRTSTPMGGGGGGGGASAAPAQAASGSTPATPRSLKARARPAAASGGGSSAQTGSGGSKGDRVVGRKETGEQKKALDQYHVDYRISVLADKAKAHPTGPQDAQLALAIIKGAAGRVNMQEFALMTQNAGIENSMDAIYKRAKDGTLPDDIRDKLVEVAHNMSAASQAAYAESMRSGKDQAAGASGTGSLTDDQFLIKLGGK